MVITLDMLADTLGKHAVRTGGSAVRIDGWAVGPAAQSAQRVRFVHVISPEDLPGLPAEAIPAVACASMRRRDDLAATIEADAIISSLGERELANALQAAYARLRDWDLRLLEAIANRRAEAEVLSIGAEMLDNPVALTDSAAVLVCHAGEVPDGGGSSIWKAIFERGFAPLSFYTRDEAKMLQETLISSPQPLRFTPKRDPLHEYLVAPLVIDGKMFGSLSQTNITAPFTQGQIDLLAFLRDRLQQMVAASMAPGTGGERGLERCLRQIVRNEHLAPSIATYYLREHSWGLDEGYRILALPLPEGHRGDVAANSFHMQVRRALPKALSILEKGSVVAAIRMADYDEVALERMLRPLVDEFNIFGGLSCTFESFMDLGIAYSQAQIACSTELRPERCGIISYGAILPTRLAGLVAMQGADDELLHPKVRELQRARGDRSADALRVLEMYLVCGCNTSKTAARLFIHRSTLLYQVARIEEELGLNLTELATSEQEHLIISCMLAQLV